MKLQRYKLIQDLMCEDEKGDYLKAQDVYDCLLNEGDLDLETFRETFDSRFDFGALNLERDQAQLIWDLKDVPIAELRLTNGMVLSKDFVMSPNGIAIKKTDDFWESLENYL